MLLVRAHHVVNELFSNTSAWKVILYDCKICYMYGTPTMAWRSHHAGEHCNESYCKQAYMLYMYGTSIVEGLYVDWLERSRCTSGDLLFTNKASLVEVVLHLLAMLRVGGMPSTRRIITLF
jgi:hypothetical protein